MNIILKIAGTDRSSVTRMGSLRYTDNINNKVDTANFVIEYHTGQTFRPQVNQSIEILDGTTKLFTGGIINISESVDEDNDSVLIYECECKDNVQYLDRKVIVERYDDITVQEIIETLVADYAPDFTTVNVNCLIDVKTIVFNNMMFSEALQKLATLTNYSWYIDELKDIHFFAKNDELAPYNLTDTSDNYIYTSLELKRDLSQIKNRVKITGGEAEANLLTETLSGTGTKKQFPLANKFAHKPTVTVGGVAKTVGVEYLDDETLFDLMWDFNQKYLRFKDATIPALGTDNIAVTEHPLKQITVQVEDPASILIYGEYEFAKEMKTIRSTDEAILFAQSELKAYSDGLREGNFQTYNSGLRSGQVINITSALRGVDEDYLIQRVGFKMISKNLGIWTVDLATLRTLNLIDVLQQLLQKEEVREGEDASLLTFKQFTDTVGVTGTVTPLAKKSGPYRAYGTSPTGGYQYLRPNFSKISA